MGAFLKLGSIQGEATDGDHKNWILLESMSSSINRSIASGAVDTQRTKGTTSLGDVVCVRQLDKSSTKIQEACANGTFFPEAEIHFCSQVGNKQEPYLKYKLENVIVTGYSFHGNHSGSPMPTEEVTLGFTKVEWTYIVIDPKTGKAQGQVPAKFDPGAGQS